MSLKFYNLHGHDGASIFDGIGRPEDYMKHMIQNAGEDSGGFSLTNHGNMNSIGYIASTNKKYKDSGFKISYGLEAYYLPSIDEWKKLKIKTDEEKKDQKKQVQENDLVVEDEKESKEKQYWSNPLNRKNHLVLVAYNQKGLINLYRLVTKSYRGDAFYRKPRIDLQMLKEHNEGLICSSACLAGIGAAVSRFNLETPIDEVMNLYEKEVLPIFDIFGPDRAFAELQFNKIPEQQILNLHLIEFSKRYNFKCIVTCDSHYPSAEDWRSREIYRLLGYQQKGKELDKSSIEKTIEELDCSLYLKNGDQLFEEYQKTFKVHFDNDNFIKQAIERTYDISQDLLEFVEPDSAPKFPNSVLFKDVVKDAYSVLENKVLKGLVDRELHKKQEYIDRLDEELSQIKEKGVSTYFLTVEELIDTLKNYMMVGPARGSAGGSLTCYLLGITQMDPLRWNLLWERFYGRGRKDLPDIDTDFSDKELALEILRQKFGENNVLSVSNYNRLNLKSLTKDISKLYNIPFQEVNEVTKKIELEAKDKILAEINHDQKLYELTFEKAYEHSPSFKKFIDQYPQVAEPIKSLHKETKAISTHAAGTLILDDAESCLPVIKIRGAQQSPITEGITVQHLQMFGLIKVDILGLSTLKTIKRCIELILQKENKDNSIENVWKWYDCNIHPDVIGDGDEKVFDKVYKGGKFVSIFQFTQSKVKDFSRNAQLESISEIAQATSIQRPGPLGASVDKKYVEVKKGTYERQKEHAIIEDVLGPTHGFLIFQEQFIILANRLAGFSLEDADKLRKILMKPSTELKGELLEQRVQARDRFIKGCIENGLDEQRAIDLWDIEIASFVSYSFNASHAYAYAIISYQTAYLLTFHEEEWIRACLETDPDPQAVMNEIAALGYKVSKPDILKSLGDSWSIDNHYCIPSFSVIKGIGAAAVEEIIEIRKKWERPVSDNLDKIFFKDLFESFFYDFVEVQQKKGIKIKKKWKFSKFNKRAMEALIKCEAFDALGFVGEGRLFENYGHMCRVLIENWDKKEQIKFDILKLCEETDATDFTDQERIEFQNEFIGTYDKMLLIDEEMIRNLEDAEIYPLEFVCEQKQAHWFILNEFETKKSSNGRQYYKMAISDIDGTIKMLNYFGWLKEPLKKNALYAGELYMNGDWLNMKGPPMRIR